MLLGSNKNIFINVPTLVIWDLRPEKYNCIGIDWRKAMKKYNKSERIVVVQLIFKNHKKQSNIGI